MKTLFPESTGGLGAGVETRSMVTFSPPSGQSLQLAGSFQLSSMVPSHSWACAGHPAGAGQRVAVSRWDAFMSVPFLHPAKYRNLTLHTGNAVDGTGRTTDERVRMSVCREDDGHRTPSVAAFWPFRPLHL